MIRLAEQDAMRTAEKTLAGLRTMPGEHVASPRDARSEALQHAGGDPTLRQAPELATEPGPVRVLFLLSHLHKGGMQRAVSNISLSLPESIEQHVAYFGSDEPGYRFRAVVHNFGLSAKDAPTMPRKFINAARRIAALRRLVLDSSIDTVVSFGESANLYNLITPHRARKVISIRTVIDEDLAGSGRVGSFFRRLIDLAYPHADQVVCVSSSLARCTVAVWPQLEPRVSVINNLYHLDSIRAQACLPLPVDHAGLATCRFVLAVGALSGHKGHDLLIDAFAHDCIPDDVRLVLLGGGELRSDLAARAAALGLAERCDFIEFDQNPYRYMARANVFALPSRFEGFPNALVEAMACGTPVVAFDCPTGPREILGASEHGLLVPAQSVQLLAEAIGRLLRSPAERRRFGAAARARSEDFGAGRIAHQWAELLSAPKGRAETMR